MSDQETASPPSEAPASSVREQLITAAGEHFAKFGYSKTTLVDLAKAIGFSKSYFYRFFRSKQQIGEAICEQTLNGIIAGVELELSEAQTATDKLRRMLKYISILSKDLFFSERMLYDIAMVSRAENWSSSQAYARRLAGMVQEILAEGRASGEFERKTPLDETSRAIMLAMQSFIDPRALQYNLDAVPDGCNDVVALILRSLAP